MLFFNIQQIQDGNRIQSERLQYLLKNKHDTGQNKISTHITAQRQTIILEPTGP